MTAPSTGAKQSAKHSENRTGNDLAPTDSASRFTSVTELDTTDASRPGRALDRLDDLDTARGTAHRKGAPRGGTAGAAGGGDGGAAGVGAVSAPQLNRRGRLRKWDRPKPPMDWRWWVGNLGKTLIATGLLMFGFVAYQLWGTGIETARAQSELEGEFDALLAAAPPAVAAESEVEVEPGDEPTSIPTADPDAPAEQVDPTLAPTEPATTVAPVPAEQQNIPVLDDGDPLARLEIPRIGRDDIVVAGVKTGDLKRGPGHFPDTPLPGQLGNAAVAGHRTTYGEPFGDIDKLQTGDEIIATTLNGRYTYRVTGQQIVESSDYWVVATADPNRATLTLISCHPKYTAQRRIVIFSELVASESAPVGEAVLNYGRPAEPDAADPSGAATEAPDATGDTGPDAAADDPTITAADTAADDPTITAVDTAAGDPPIGAESSDPDGGVSGNVGEIDVLDPADGSDESPSVAPGDVSSEIVDAFSDGWFSDPGANVHVGLWGALLALIGTIAYAVSRRLRRDWAGALVGLLPFVVTLYFFFQNVNRLLPPNL